MWNFKRLLPNVSFKVNLMFEKNVRMFSKKGTMYEKPNAVKSSGKNSPDASNIDTKMNESDNKKVICRSSMICSEGFDKYTYDCHKNIPSRSVGLNLEAVAVPQENVQGINLPAYEKDSFANAHSSSPVNMEQSAIRKISTSIKALSSVPTSIKNASRPFKNVPEETIPVNAPLSYKRVPEETVPVSQFTPMNSNSTKSSVTTIPSSFNPTPEQINWHPYRSALKTNPIKSAPVKNTPFSFKHVPDESSPVRNAPLSFKLSPEKSQPVSKAFSFRGVSDEFSPIRTKPLSLKIVPAQYTPNKSAPFSYRHAPEKNTSSNYVADEPIPVRNAPLSLKYAAGESISLRNIPSSLQQFSNEPFTPIQNISSPLQPVPEEPMAVHSSQLSSKSVTDEPVSFWNSHLSFKPKLTKHISLLKKKTSFKSPIIKRDSVVHPGRTDMQSSLFIDGRFQNPWPTWRPPTFTNVLKFGITRDKSKVPSKQELDLILPIVKQNFSKLSIPDDGIRVTWIGHSTVLIQMHGLNILTDPMFSDRASPSQVVGPKRYRDPPCTIHDLPHINAVVISHSHYDHLDHNTVTLLNARFGSDIRWFVPLGLQIWMEKVGCENVVELDWWEENHVPEHSETFFVFTPAQHWSKRALGDDNKVLWGSWCILGPKYKFFFAGDTGYCDVFKQIGRVHGPFDLSAIPIGAYEPRWFMKHQHVNPEEAVKIHMDVKSKKTLAIHWGTFSLANEYYLDPPVKLRESLDKNEIPPELFFTLKHGESRLISQNNFVKKGALAEKK